MTEKNQLPDPEEKLSTVVLIFSFIMPLIGAIVYFSNKDSHPKKATQACHAALWGLLLGIVLNTLARLGGKG